MKVLMITGDKKFASSERFRLQAAQVEKLEVLYWGRGALWPHVPKEKFDVVSAQDPFWRGHVAWYLSRRLHAQLNIQVHTDLSAQPWWKRVWAGFNLRKASSVRVVSQKIEQQVSGMGVTAPVHVLPIFIDISKFTNITRAPHAQKIILWIGRFEGEKNPLQAIRVFQEVRVQGVDAKLVMLGVGSLAPALRKAAKGLPVELLGWQDPAAFLAEADVVLSTSLHESYGASILEGLAAGVPVVAPDVGVAKEAGATVVPRKDLATAVVNILQKGGQGVLKIHVLNADEWAAEWKKTL